LLFNASLGGFFGFVHQGGVVPALCALQSWKHHPASPANVIFFHTYMPPMHLLCKNSPFPATEEYDLAGASLSELYSTVANVYQTNFTQPIYVLSPGIA
jgi:hypothetical protein